MLKPANPGLQPELKMLTPANPGLQPELKMLTPAIPGLRPELKMLTPANPGLQPELKMLTSAIHVAVNHVCHDFEGCGVKDIQVKKTNKKYEHCNTTHMFSGTGGLTLVVCFKRFLWTKS